jgi:hypothetical protein
MSKETYNRSTTDTAPLSHEPELEGRVKRDPQRDPQTDLPCQKRPTTEIPRTQQHTYYVKRDLDTDFLRLEETYKDTYYVKTKKGNTLSASEETYKHTYYVKRDPQTHLLCQQKPRQRPTKEGKRTTQYICNINSELN